MPLNSILGSQKMPLNVDIKRHFEKTPQKTFYVHVLDGVLINASKGL
jgi:hypothetical protein